MYVCFVVRERFVFVIASQSRIPLLLQLQLPQKMPAKKQLNAKACRIMTKSKAKQGAKAHQLAKAPPAEPPHVKADPELVNPGLKSPPTPTDQSKVSKAACPDDIPYATAKARWRRAMPGHVDQRTSVPRGPKDSTNKIPSEAYAEIMKDKSAAKKWFESFRAAGCVWDDATLEEETLEVLQNTDKDNWAWVTRDQAAKILNNKEVAERKCDVAEKDPERFKVDEDCPELSAAYKYWIKVREGSEEAKAKAHNKRAKFSAAASNEQAYQVARTMMPKSNMALKGPPAKSSTPVGTEGAPSGLSEEERLAAKAKEEAAAVLKEQKKQEAAKAKAEAKAKMQASPEYQIGKWLSGISGMMRQCDEDIAKAKASTKIPRTMAEQYCSRFTASVAEMKTMRDQLEEADPSSTQLLAEANTAITTFQHDLKAFGLLYKAYHPPPTAKASQKAEVAAAKAPAKASQNAEAPAKASQKPEAAAKAPAKGSAPAKASQNADVAPQ